MMNKRSKSLFSRNNWTLAMALLAIGSILITSCNNDRACRNDQDCGTFGNCIELSSDNLCNCIAGYEVDTAGLCEIRSFDKFVGTWQAVETRVNNSTFETSTLSYTVNITADTSALTRVSMQGFGDFDNTACDFSEPIEVVATVGTRTIQVLGATYCPAPTMGRNGYVLASRSGTNSIDEATQSEITLAYLLTTDEPDPLQPNTFIQVSYECEVVMTKN